MKKDEAYLRHILDAISDIEKFTKDVTKEGFFENKEKQYAVLRALEVIGEATKNLSKQSKAKYPDVPWRDAAGMRDKLIHGYFGVNLELVWETIKNELPGLKKRISRILREEEAKGTKKGVEGFLKLKDEVSRRWTGRHGVLEEARRSKHHNDQ